MGLRSSGPLEVPREKWGWVMRGELRAFVLGTAGSALRRVESRGEAGAAPSSPSSSEQWAGSEGCKPRGTMFARFCFGTSPGVQWDEWIGGTPELPGRGRCRGRAWIQRWGGFW